MAGELQDPDRTPRLLTVSQVAKRIRWSEDSVREHLVSIDEWKRLSAQQRAKSEGDFVTSKVPRIELGHQVRIPAWWVETLEEIVGGPPRAA